MRFLRSFIFDASFYIASFILMILFLPLMLLPQKVIFWAGRVWVHVSMGLLRTIVGLTYRVEGLENLPKGPCIVACKHESAWETLIFHILVNRPCYALKRELMWIPLINLYFWRMGMVIIDRGAGASALKSLINGARRITAQGRPLIIYPEGTRSIPGKPAEYQAGVGVLYRDLGVPVVPVALNSGLFWGRRSPLKQPGQITIQFLEPIQPGLSRADFMEKLVDRIEMTCETLNKVKPN
ncbi:MAG: 1-acyl-sn-glycerol-3-phosphate acyltransferase [Alphaproteobacteria bacterium]|nr:1-acyl-sn-glycerol-3-phosphate acyltransferase [Alphaproteobacteria bacterium]